MAKLSGSGLDDDAAAPRGLGSPIQNVAQGNAVRDCESLLCIGRVCVVRWDSTPPASSGKRMRVRSMVPRVPGRSRANRKLFRVRRLVGTFWLAKSWFVGLPDKSGTMTQLDRLALPTQPVDATPSKALLRHCFPGRTDLSAFSRSKPSQDIVSADLTLASDFSFCYHCKLGSS
jgi:hypothetical protein